MATIDLGKIKFNWRGTYAGGTAYVPDDVVYYMDGSVGSSYMCVANTTGNAPSSGGTLHASWEYLAKGQATSPTTTQGDLIVRGASADERLAIGSAGQAVKVNSSGNGLEYGTAGGILQVKTSSNQDAAGSVSVSSTNTLYDLPNHNVTITPSNANNKILISFQATGETTGNSHSYSIVLKRTISGGSSTLIQGDIGGQSSKRPVFTQTLQVYDVGDQDTTLEIAHCSNYLDSPNTTSAVTYQLQVKNHEGGTGTYYYNRNVRDDNATHSERGLSWVTAMEVASGVL
jgi:hypothetical protein